MTNPLLSSRKKIGERLRKLRIDAKLEQEEVGRLLDYKAGTRQQRVGHLESGRSPLGHDDAYKLGKLYGVSPLFIYYGESARPIASSEPETLPLLSWHSLKDASPPMHAGKQLSIFWPTDVGAGGYVVPVVGNKFAARFNNGDYIVVDPAAKPRSGEFILVFVDGSSTPVICEVTRVSNSLLFHRLDTGQLVNQKSCRVAGVIKNRIEFL